MIDSGLKKHTKDFIIKLMFRPAKFFWLSLILIVVLPLLSCSGLTSAQKELNNNQQKWNEKKVGGYSYQLKVECFCPQDITRPVIVAVREGASEIVYADDGTVPSSDFFNNYNTIEKLFKVALNALQNADGAQITYDDRYGFPSRINIDFQKNLIDDEASYSVADFRLLEHQ